MTNAAFLGAGSPMQTLEKGCSWLSPYCARGSHRRTRGKTPRRIIKIPPPPPGTRTLSKAEPEAHYLCKNPIT